MIRGVLDLQLRQEHEHRHRSHPLDPGTGARSEACIDLGRSIVPADVFSLATATLVR